jgi:surfeit locus 1 family protein
VGRIGKQVSYPLVPAYLELESTQPTPTTVQPTLIALPELDEGPHLSYAAQWFFFSGCAIVGWILAVRRSAKQRDTVAPPEVQHPEGADVVTAEDPVRPM